MCGEIGCGFILRARRHGDEHARLEIGEPGGHHQIVGGHFNAHFPRLVDVGQILFGKRQNGNLREVNLVVAGELEKQIERAFKAADIDDQGAVGIGNGFLAHGAFAIGP